MARRSILDLFRRRKKKDEKPEGRTEEVLKQAGSSRKDIESRFEIAGKKPTKDEKAKPKKPAKKKPKVAASRKTVAEIAAMVRKSQAEKKKRREALAKASLTGKK